MRWSVAAVALEENTPMLSSVARKLQDSIRNGDPFEPDWFQDALTTALSKGKGLDEVIWDAVRELLDQAEKKKE